MGGNREKEREDRGESEWGRIRAAEIGCERGRGEWGNITTRWEKIDRDVERKARRAWDDIKPGEAWKSLILWTNPWINKRLLSLEPSWQRQVMDRRTKSIYHQRVILNVHHGADVVIGVAAQPEGLSVVCACFPVSGGISPDTLTSSHSPKTRRWAQVNWRH